MSHPHPDLAPPAALPRNGLRIVALGGLGEIGRNMTVFEYRGRLLIVDCGVLFPDPDQPGVDLILPDFGYLEGRLDQVEALVLTHAHEDHIGAVPYLLRERPDIPLAGSKLDPGPGAEQAGRAPPGPDHGRGGGGQPQLVRPVRLRVPRGQPLDPRRARGGHQDPGRGGAAHRRLQDGPTPPGRTAYRSRWVRPARHRGRRPADGRLDQRRGARRGDLRARDRAGARRDLRPTPPSASSWPASPRTCTGCSRCSTPP